MTPPVNLSFSSCSTSQEVRQRKTSHQKQRIQDKQRNDQVEKEQANSQLREEVTTSAVDVVRFLIITETVSVHSSSPYATGVLIVVEKAGTSLLTLDWIKAFQVDVDALLYSNTPRALPSTIYCNVIEKFVDS